MSDRRLLVVMFQLGDQANGGVNSLCEILYGLEDYAITVLTQLNTPLNERLRAAGMTVVVAPPDSTGSGLLVKLRFANWVRRQLRREDYSLVHVNDMQALLHTMAVWKWWGIPVVYNIRGVFARGRKYGVHWRIVNYCDKVIALSKDMRENLRRRLPLNVAARSGNLLDFVYSIVDFERFHPVGDADEKLALRSRLGLPAEGFLAIYVAKFGPKKLQLEYIDRVLRQRSGELLAGGVVTAFVGDMDAEHNAYARRCATALEALDSSLYHVAGYRANVEDYYRAADLVIVPSLREGMARCMIEGASCGIPVVSFEVTSAREILEDHAAGWVVEQGGYDELADKMIELAGDPVACREAGANGFALSRELFDRKEAVRAYEAIYSSLA